MCPGITRSSPVAHLLSNFQLRVQYSFLVPPGVGFPLIPPSFDVVDQCSASSSTTVVSSGSLSVRTHPHRQTIHYSVTKSPLSIKLIPKHRKLNNYCLKHNSVLRDQYNSIWNAINMKKNQIGIKNFTQDSLKFQWVFLQSYFSKIPIPDSLTVGSP